MKHFKLHLKYAWPSLWTLPQTKRLHATGQTLWNWQCQSIVHQTRLPQRTRYHRYWLTSDSNNVSFVYHPSASCLESRPAVQCVCRFWGIRSISAVDTGHANTVSAQTGTRMIHQQTTAAQSVERNPEKITNSTLVTLHMSSIHTFTTAVTATTTNASNRSILHHHGWSSRISNVPSSQSSFSPQFWLYNSLVVSGSKLHSDFKLWLRTYNISE